MIHQNLIAVALLSLATGLALAVAGFIEAAIVVWAVYGLCGVSLLGLTVRETYLERIG